MIILSGTLGLISQESQNKHKITLSPNLGLNLSNSNFKNLGKSETCCSGFSSGFGTGLNFGAGYSYLIEDKTWIYFGLDYSKLNSDFIEFENEAINIDGTNRLDAKIEQKVVSKISALGINLGASLELLKSIEAYIGYRLGLPSNIDYTQTETLIEPNEGVFQETNSRIRTNESGTLKSNLYHSIVGKIGYKLFTNKDETTYISPNIGFNIGLNSIYDNMNLKHNSINFGVDLAYEFNLEQSPTIEDENKHEKKLSKTDSSNNESNSDTTLLASAKKNIPRVIISPISVDINGKRQQGGQIDLDEVKSIKMTPLLNYIFFETDSSNIPLRYSLLSKTDSHSFNTKNLFEKNTIEIYHHLLNIIGERMINNPKSDLKIVGTKSEIEKGEKAKVIAIDRAKSVRDYLVETWGINSDRLKISSIDAPYIPSKGTDEKSIEENQRVELYSDNDKLLEPLILKDTLYTPITEEIKFYTVLDTNIKLNKWKLIITDNDGKTINEIDDKSNPPLIINFKITDQIANQIKDADDLNYRFELVDKEGTIENVTGRFLININTLKYKESKKLSDNRIDKYSLILFDYDKFELNKKNLDIIKYIKSNINNKTKLLISGYSDIIGDENYNKELSKKRTESVFEQFNENKDKQEFPYGESILLFNNNLPEGRFYSRTVIINAITPISK